MRIGTISPIPLFHNATRQLHAPLRQTLSDQVERRGSDDGGKLFPTDGDKAQAALKRVQEICAVAEVGKIYLGKVVRIVDFGAFVEIFPGTDGLLHISEIAESRVKQVTDELQEGDMIQVKCLAIEGNKIKLSRKAVLKELREAVKKGGDKSGD